MFLLSGKIITNSGENFHKSPKTENDRKRRQSKWFVSFLTLKSVATKTAGVIMAKTNRFHCQFSDPSMPEISICIRNSPLFLVSCAEIGLFACKSKDTRLWMQILSTQTNSMPHHREFASTCPFKYCQAPCHKRFYLLWLAPFSGVLADELSTG